MVVIDQYTRRIIGFCAHAGNVDGLTLCRMLNQATSGQDWPKYLSSDNDPLFQYHRWRANLRVLDQTLFWTGTDLENELQNYQCYYNECRTHSGRDGRTPNETIGHKVVDINQYRWEKYYRGLFQLPVAA
tara:strand:- start:47 stop:436 length:390 start_codon:yes stop_codon:yes gene_type:complete